MKKLVLFIILLINYKPIKPLIFVNDKLRDELSLLRFANLAGDSEQIISILEKFRKPHVIDLLSKNTPARNFFTNNPPGRPFIDKKLPKQSHIKDYQDRIKEEIDLAELPPPPPPLTPPPPPEIPLIQGKSYSVADMMALVKGLNKEAPLPKGIKNQPPKKAEEQGPLAKIRARVGPQIAEIQERKQARSKEERWDENIKK